MPRLNRRSLRRLAGKFGHEMSVGRWERKLYGVTDGKKIGTWFEKKFKRWLKSQGYSFRANGSASGIDLPGLKVDIKLTKAEQPQSSISFKSPEQKVFGLKYALLIFFYEMDSDHDRRAVRIRIVDTLFLDERRTADHATTSQLRDLLDKGAGKRQIVAFLQEQKIPATLAELRKMASKIMASPPLLGHMTISNALQWRGQYGRTAKAADTGEDGVWRCG